MLSTLPIKVVLLTRTSDENVALEFNKKLEEILKKGGKLEGYTLLRDGFNGFTGSRVVDFLATFSDLNSDIGSVETFGSMILSGDSCNKKS